MMTRNDTVLEARALAYVADGTTLLSNVDLQLHAGEVLGIVGPNGAGKSTLLKLLAGIEVPSSGQVLLDAAPLHASEKTARELGWLEQRPQVQWSLQVEQVVALGRLPHGDADTAHAEQSIAHAFATTATDGLRERAFHSLSEGEKVRVHLARVLAAEPRIVLADEPVAALDPWYQLQVLDLLRAEARRGKAVALVLHDLQLAARYCERLLVLDRGTVKACGPAAETLTESLLADVWRIAASFDSATLALTIHGRLPASTQNATA